MSECRMLAKRASLTASLLLGKIYYLFSFPAGCENLERTEGKGEEREKEMKTEQDRQRERESGKEVER